MSQHSVNFGEWLRRLGFKTGTEPRFIEAIQPVQVIGDASALTPPFIPNAAWTGGQISGVVAEFPVIQITGSAPGGTIVSAFRVRAHAGLGKFSLEIRRPRRKPSPQAALLSRSRTSALRPSRQRAEPERMPPGTTTRCLSRSEGKRTPRSTLTLTCSSPLDSRSRSDTRLPTSSCRGRRWLKM